MKTVYVVTRGSFCDYGIEAIFDTRKAAELHKLQVQDHNDVEEWSLIESADPAPKTVMVYAAAAEWFRDNPNGEIRCWSFDKWDYDLHDIGLAGRTRVTLREGDAPAGHYIRAWTLDPERAVKAVADRRAQYLARLAGVA